jgi:hypothetical protein
MDMWFGRHAKGLRSSQAVSGRARDDRWTPWAVYKAACKANRRLLVTYQITLHFSTRGVPLHQVYGLRESRFWNGLQGLSVCRGILVFANDQNAT